MVRFRPSLGLLAALALAAAPVLVAQPSEPAAPQLDIAWQRGPLTARLSDQAEVEVTDGYVFAGPADTRKILQAGGNIPSGNELGLLSPVDEQATWFLVFEYEDTGHVDDEDRAEIDADGLFQQISEGTEEANKVRQKQGFTAIHLTRWTEPPHYDTGSNNLEWALEAKDDGGGSVVNYNIRVLGREGVTSVTLVADPGDFGTLKAEVEKVLGGFRYVEGKRYADFRSGDKLAGYGLTALVAGGAGLAAAKLGLFGKLGKLLVGFWKLLVLGVVALGTAIKKLFRRSPTVATYPPPPPPPAP